MAHRDFDIAPRTSILDRVVEQIVEQDADQHRLRIDLGEHVADQHHVDVLLLRITPVREQRISRDRGRLHRLGGQLLLHVEPREQQQLLGEPGAAIDALHDALHREPLQPDVGLRERDLRLHLDCGERRLQFVRGIGGEGALEFERMLQTREHLVDRIDERAHLERRAADADRFHAVDVARTERGR
ncbi:hypothetical protein OKW50_001184 [Paraburkholderia youngii]